MLVQKFRSAVNAEGSACGGAVTGERYISLNAPPSICVASCNLSIQYSAVLLLIFQFLIANDCLKPKAKSEKQIQNIFIWLPVFAFSFRLSAFSLLL